MTRILDFLIYLIGIVGVALGAYAFGMMQHDTDPRQPAVEIIASTTDWDI